VTVHPATVLLSWVAAVVALQSLTVVGLGWVALLLLPLPLTFARRRTFVLVRRARWLLVSIAVMFALATPGERLPGMVGDLGVTYDGLVLATEHVLRLTLLLATLALVHEHLGTTGMMSGFHWLLAPLGRWQTLRERIVVRLMLILDYVEVAPSGSWRTWLSADIPGPDKLNLVIHPLHLADRAVLALLGALMLTLAWLA
jgi:hypothetical protein